jgi:Tol biopolymer transport system component
MIAFTRLQQGDAAVHLVDPASGVVRRLTDPGVRLYDPTWSPDGSRLVALGRGDGGGQGLYVVDVTDGTARAIMLDGAAKLRPAWSPDAGEIVMELAVGRSGYHLWAVRPDGTGLRQITGPPLRPELPPPPPAEARVTAYLEVAPGEGIDEVEERPTWSPDGREIAFVRPAAVPRLHADESGIAHHLWAVGRDGTNARPLTDGPVHDLDPAWSPDGRRIAFTRYVDRDVIRTGEGSHSAVRIWTIGADGSDLRLLTSEPAVYQAPSWSPHGDYLVCSRSTGGPTHLFVIPVHASGGEVLTDPDEDGDYDPVWRPEGGSGYVL